MAPVIFSALAQNLKHLMPTDPLVMALRAYFITFAGIMVILALNLCIVAYKEGTSPGFSNEVLGDEEV